MHINFKKTRHFSIFFIFVFLFVLVFTRLIYIQIISSKRFTDIAEKQHRLFVKLKPERGKIYDRLNRVLAINLDTVSIYAVPREMDDKKARAKVLAKEFSVDEKALLKQLERDNYFAWVKRQVEPATAKKAEKLGIEGVYLINEAKRFYPAGALACHALGMTGIDSDGLEGIELYYNRELAGEYGWRRSIRDAKQREVNSSRADVLPARNGNNIVLTIDQVIQHTIESEIADIVKSYRPEAVSIIALDPNTGEILGLANYPYFDPNMPSNIKADSMRNRAVADSFEPGSVFKIFTASAAIEEGVVDFDSIIYCENGAYKVGRRTLHDYRPYGELTFREVIEKSSNIGTAKVAEKLGKDKLAYYIKRFNFNSPTGVDLPGEVQGIMRDVKSWSLSDMTTVPMGQGIAVTAMQLAGGVCAIANGGIFMKPYIVKSLLTSDGEVIKDNKPEQVRRVISKESAAKVGELMNGVVERGTGKGARLSDFRACGKTGTAEKVNPRGGYYKDKYIASFIGFAPYEKPAVVLVVCVDEPRGKYFGGQVAAPAFKHIMDKILSYMGTESDKNEIKKTS